MFHPAKCNSCGKDIQVPNDTNTAVCMYCGSSIIVNESIQINVGANAINLLALAKTATVAGNYKEAYEYYNKVLEIDPTNSIAWFGKGESAGWLSSLSEFRFSEMIIGFQNAVRFSEPTATERMKQNCASTMNEVATACYSISRNHVLEFIALNNTWADYLQKCKMIIDLYITAHEYNPHDQVILKNIVHMCGDNIQGIKYNDQYDNNISKVQFLSPAYENEIRSILNKYAEKLKLLDESYIKPNPEAQKPNDCFVMTATMGDENHPSVIYLRKFRDELLTSSKAGIKFIEWYYCHGPKAAKFIEQSKTAKIISRIILVTPSVWTAKVITRLAKTNKNKVENKS